MTAVGGNRLRALVHQFSISFRLRPVYTNVAGARSESGFEVELIGQHHAMGKHRSGGCPHCLKVLLVLLELNDVALSEQEHLHSDGHIGAQYEKLIRYASTARDWPEVVLGVKIMRPTAVQHESEGWLLRLTDKIRAQLVDLDCRELPFVSIPSGSMADRGLVLAERAV